MGETSRTKNLVDPALGTAFLVGLIGPLIQVSWKLLHGMESIAIRETPILWIVRYVAESNGHQIAEALPRIVNLPLEAGGPRGFITFVAGATVANTIWMVPAALAIAIVAGRWRVRRPGAAAITAAVTSVPAMVAGADYFLRSSHQFRTIALAVFASALPALVAFALFAKRGRRAIAWRWVSAVVTVALAGWLAIGSSALARTGRGVERPPTRPGAPNILLISIDSLRADRLHCYGNPRATSPVLDRIASEGAMFENAIAPSSWTLPSHMTLLTALPPEIHGVDADDVALVSGVPTLASILRDEGYRTAGYVSGLFLDHEFGFSAGFDEYDDYTAVAASPRLQRQARTAGVISALGKRWLDGWRRSGGSRPFFLFLHYFDVHYDYVPPPPFDTMFDPGYDGPIDGRLVHLSKTIHPGMAKSDLRHLVSLYDGEIRSTDGAIGEVVDRLKSMGILDRTIVVIVSDHGDEFLEHGDVGHRTTLYDEVLRVPLIFRYPGTVPAGRRIEDQVRLMDVAPTILDLAGLDRRIGIFDGAENRAWMATSLVPMIDADPDVELPPLPAFGQLAARLESLRTSRAKVILNLQNDRAEYYDLVDDPGERRNLAGSGLAEAEAMVAELRRWMAATRGESRSAATTLTEDQREALRSLGYLQ